MRSGVRTVLLVCALLVVAAGGAAGAWALGRSAPTAAVAPWTPTSPSDDRTVRLGPDTADDPMAAEVRTVLQRYFDAINTGDHDAWTAVVSAGQTVSQDRATWEHRYSTTLDSSIVLVSVDQDPTRVRVWFSSRQDPAFAPADLPANCISWDLTYRVVTQDGRLVIDGIDPTPQNKAAC
ncbi:hypothetical protein JL107_00390 [Nakamurella flavida]|uniref:Nuclear transport factor 2 family protein n=1 Tax=Nakamurella flavida TaxID=363630 RepID=A0A938YKW2_9ACTN|nr:hypothetical protein [Nakamurella flavida]MBM9474893.1 hypothetical protein [Nakamurella flavida]MDP9776462.1 hypothetical protein [Nakamurella flavida]